MKNLYKNHKGITLIALIITIIVLLILAGVTIAAITSNESAPNKAVQARDENERGAAKDAATLLVQEKIQAYYEGKYVGADETARSSSSIRDYLENENVLGATNGVTTGEFTVKVANEKITVKKGDTLMATGSVDASGVITWDAVPGGQQGGNGQGGGQQASTGDPIYGGLAETSEAEPSLFTYEIVSDDDIEIGKVDGVIENGKVADNSGLIKVADNSGKKTAKITGINSEGILQYVNILSDYDPENEDVIFNAISYDIDDEGNSTSTAISVTSWKSVPDFITKLVIPSTVKLKPLGFNNIGNIDDTGETYEIIGVGDLSDIYDKVNYLIFPDTVTNISRNMKNIKNVRFPNREIHDYDEVSSCFGWENASFENLICPINIASLYNDNVKNTLKSLEITIPKEDIEDIEDMYIDCYDYSLLENVKLPEGIKRLGRYEMCSSLKNINIPSSVEYIDAQTFQYCTSLKNITIPNSIKEIGDAAFAGCTNLTQLNLPENVEKLGKAMFGGSGVKTIRIPASVSNISDYNPSITDYGYFNYASINVQEKIEVDNNNQCFTSFDDALYNKDKTILLDIPTKKTSIKIPSSVSKIESWASSQCSMLSDVYYEGTEQEWNSITKLEERNAPIINATIHYNSQM